ncbi:MAG: ATP-binding protein [Candidatus Aminicenantes bacterium]|nr:ATP-binding protein [Candidatus Aminicenantes bacterium]
MKINKVHFEDHPFFGTMDIDFSGSDGSRPLNTVVIAGINGSGKTTLLDAIVDMMTDAANPLEKSYLEIELTELYEKKLLHWEYYDLSSVLGWNDGDENKRRREIIKFNAGKKDESRNLIDKFKQLEDSEKPRIVYMPTEINFSKIVPKINPYVYKYKFLNIVDENVAQDVPNYFATDIDRGVYSSDQKPAAESIKKVCDEINSIFKELEMESWITGLKKDGSRMPIFRNKIGKEFDITGLSSGEMQLFLRIMSLRMMQINNSIILVDEPEISLHPSWQQRIIKVYENIGKNNQVIAATHSPHVVSSVPNENLRILLVDPPGIQVLDHRDIRNSYGVAIKRVLKDIMLLKSDRDPEIQSRIDGLKSDLKRDDYNPAKFETSFNELEEILGTTDEELIRIKMEMLRKEKKARDAENR